MTIRNKGREQKRGTSLLEYALPAALALSLCLGAGAMTIDQTVVLSNGWNAVYVGVAPQMSADEVFAEWPVWSVSAYNADAFLYTASTEGGKTGEGVVRAPFWIWSRESPASSTLRSLQADTVLLCYSTNAAPYTVTLRGIPVAPRIAWHVSDDTFNTNFRNMFGVRLSGPVKASDWLAGCPAVENATLFYISGTDESEPRLRPLATGTKSAYLNDGSVVFATGSRVSGWSGPLYITPRDGFDLGDSQSLGVLTVRNDGAAEKTVRLTLQPAADPYQRTPEIMCRESYADGRNGTWTNWNASLERTLPTGETWRVSIAIDRTKLSGSGELYGAVIEIAEQGGTQSLAYLPVSVADAPSANPWPKGLWLATIKLNKVSWYRKDGDRVDGVAAGGVMTVKVPISVDAHGGAKLVQRARVDGVRISSAYLPVDLGAVDGTGAFGSGTLAFAYTIGATSPSNPFRHALHPLFDGKQMDFKTPAPDGDDLENYVGEVKPEWFSIGGEVEFAFADSDATPWTPLEKLSGTAKWMYTGVRRDGPVVAEGPFTMQRIAKEYELDE